LPLRNSVSVILDRLGWSDTRRGGEINHRRNGPVQHWFIGRCENGEKAFKKMFIVFHVKRNIKIRASVSLKGDMQMFVKDGLWAQKT
jgi:hypothetical protein